MKLTAASRNSSIRVKLSVLTVLNCGFALLLAGICLFAYESYQQRNAAAHELTSQADILAESSTAALSFNDERAATQNLTALRGDSNVAMATIFGKDNLPFAHYQRNGGSSVVALERPRPVGAYFENGELLVFAPVSLGGERIGTIFLKSTNDVYARLLRYIGIVCVVMVVSLLLTLLLGSGTQRSIANPITALSVLSRRVSLDKDYSVRATRSTGGEIGVLVDSFNDMLTQIEAREAAQRVAEELLRESEERYALAARGANDGLWDWKLPDNEIYFSPRWYQMLGYSENDCWSRPTEWFGLIPPVDRDRVKAELMALRDGPQHEMAIEYRMKHKSGALIWVLTRGIAIRDEQGIAVRMAGSQTDITEGKVADPLTGLPNRLYFTDRLEGAFGSAAQSGTLFAVLFLDLDKFKVVNDSLGHAAGDELLMGVASRLNMSVRASPQQSTEKYLGGAIVARLGGDEFSVLLSNLSSEADAVIVAERILDNLKTPFDIQGREVFASASIGIALSSTGKTAEDLMHNADTAMYQAKAGGKCCFKVFDERMRKIALAHLETESDLRNAIDTNELVICYQPEVSLKDQRTIGFEALVRWNHPQRGLLPPSEFIQVAEESDLIIRLGQWVLEHACRQMAEWHIRFPHESGLTVSVNVSPRQLSHPRLVENIEDILARTGLNSACLKLEMTESSFMADPDATLETLRRLKDMNIGLELDDFGTGYSSLSCLHVLPFDTLKIDRSFINRIGDGSQAQIVRTILELARSVGMRVVAEGVETESQIKALTLFGCDYAQGFYFSKPRSAQATEALLIERSEFRDGFKRLQESGTREPAVSPEVHDYKEDSEAKWERAPILHAPTR